MRILTATTAILGTVLVVAGGGSDLLPGRAPKVEAVATAPAPHAEIAAADLSAAELTKVVQGTCQMCHNDRMMTGNMSLEGFDVARAYERAEIGEKMIRKLRAGMMPPPGMPRPGPDTMLALVEGIEKVLDEAASKSSVAGSRTFQRLNRAEYARSVHDLLGLEIDAGAYLPLDTKSNNFDNIADVQTLSPLLLSAYLTAAAEVSRLAVGNVRATASETTYSILRTASQTEQVPGAPYGSRGGLSVIHNFPADGEYRFRISFFHETTGGFVGGLSRNEKVEVSIDGERLALLDLDRFMSSSDPNQTTMFTEPLPVKAGPHRVSVVFVPPSFQDVTQELISPLGWSIASTAIDNTPGFALLPHMRDVAVLGPYNPTGVSETEVRRRIFTCRPTSAAEEKPCAEQILTRLATQAYRRPVNAEDIAGLMTFYETGRAEGGFELGVRSALEAILASPDFVFRFERLPDNARPGQNVAVNDIELASRLSFFLWSAPPDEELLGVARQGKLSDRRVLEQQTRRMLADPRAETLATRFAAQWLRLPDLPKVFPDIRQFTHFDEQLRNSMRRETEIFISNLFREDRSFLEMYTADYTYVDERLAAHYGIPGVSGNNFQRVQYPDDTRRGIFGHGSILVLTSQAIRTSPVLRGKWVMEVVLGTPPPPPPPGVPALDATAGVQEGKVLTTRERMEQHRANPTCNACHQFMDPIGLALDNFDPTGSWRIKENGAPLDTNGKLYDGTPVTSPRDLREALLKRPVPLVRTFTENLMAYALGRRLEYYDKPTVRAIARDAEANGYKMSSFVLGVVNSDAFRMQQVVAEDADGNRQ